MMQTPLQPQAKRGRGCRVLGEGEQEFEMGPF